MTEGEAFDVFEGFLDADVAWDGGLVEADRLLECVVGGLDHSSAPLCDAAATENDLDLDSVDWDAIYAAPDLDSPPSSPGSTLNLGAGSPTPWPTLQSRHSGIAIAQLLMKPTSAPPPLTRLSVESTGRVDLPQPTTAGAAGCGTASSAAGMSTVAPACSSPGAAQSEPLQPSCCPPLPYTLYDPAPAGHGGASAAIDGSDAPGSIVPSPFNQLPGAVRTTVLPCGFPTPMAGCSSVTASVAMAATPPCGDDGSGGCCSSSAGAPATAVPAELSPPPPPLSSSSLPPPELQARDSSLSIAAAAATSATPTACEAKPPAMPYDARSSELLPVLSQSSACGAGGGGGGGGHTAADWSDGGSRAPAVAAALTAKQSSGGTAPPLEAPQPLLSPGRLIDATASQSSPLPPPPSHARQLARAAAAIVAAAMLGQPPPDLHAMGLLPPGYCQSKLQSLQLLQLPLMAAATADFQQNRCTSHSGLHRTQQQGHMDQQQQLGEGQANPGDGSIGDGGPADGAAAAVAAATNTSTRAGAGGCTCAGCTAGPERSRASLPSHRQHPYSRSVQAHSGGAGVGRAGGSGHACAAAAAAPSPLQLRSGPAAATTAATSRLSAAPGTPHYISRLQPSRTAVTSPGSATRCRGTATLAPAIDRGGGGDLDGVCPHLGASSGGESSELLHYDGRVCGAIAVLAAETEAAHDRMEVDGPYDTRCQQATGSAAGALATARVSSNGACGRSHGGGGEGVGDAPAGGGVPSFDVGGEVDDNEADLRLLREILCARSSGGGGVSAAAAVIAPTCAPTAGAPAAEAAATSPHRELVAGSGVHTACMMQPNSNPGGTPATTSLQRHSPSNCCGGAAAADAAADARSTPARPTEWPSGPPASPLPLPYPSTAPSAGRWSSPLLPPPPMCLCPECCRRGPYLSPPYPPYSNYGTAHTGRATPTPVTPASQAAMFPPLPQPSCHPHLSAAPAAVAPLPYSITNASYGAAGPAMRCMLSCCNPAPLPPPPLLPPSAAAPPRSFGGRCTLPCCRPASAAPRGSWTGCMPSAASGLSPPQAPPPHHHRTQHHLQHQNQLHQHQLLPQHQPVRRALTFSPLAGASNGPAAGACYSGDLCRVSGSRSGSGSGSLIADASAACTPLPLPQQQQQQQSQPHACAQPQEAVHASGVANEPKIPPCLHHYHRHHPHGSPYSSYTSVGTPSYTARSLAPFSSASGGGGDVRYGSSHALPAAAAPAAGTAAAVAVAGGAGAASPSASYTSTPPRAPLEQFERSQGWLCASQTYCSGGGSGSSGGGVNGDGDGAASSIPALQRLQSLTSVMPLPAAPCDSSLVLPPPPPQFKHQFQRHSGPPLPPEQACTCWKGSPAAPNMRPPPPLQTLLSASLFQAAAAGACSLLPQHHNHSHHCSQQHCRLEQQPSQRQAYHHHQHCLQQQQQQQPP